MPRRTTLLIIATLLVLLAAPAIYVACTWSTDNPLRFEAVRLERDRSLGEGSEVGTLHLTVRNVSRLPVYLSLAFFEKKNRAEDAAGESNGAILPQLQDRPEKGSPSPLFLPPGGSMQCIASIIVPDVQSPQAMQHIDVDYRWRSGTGEKAFHLWIRCIYQKMETDWLEKLIPAPGELRHRSPLILPATASAQASSTGQGSGA